MAWWRRVFGRSPGSGTGSPGGARVGVPQGSALGDAQRHLAGFATSRRGVEAYIEPATRSTSTTVVFVAHDGEWTRRAVPSPHAAADFARTLGVPVYDVHQTGYPPRMREWSSRQRKK